MPVASVSDMFWFFQQSITNDHASVADTVPAVVTAVEPQRHKSFSLLIQKKSSKKAHKVPSTFPTTANRITTSVEHTLRP